MADRIEALAFNELTSALSDVDRFVALSERQEITRRIVTVVGQEVRREIAESLRRAAAGRREYAERTPEPSPELAAKDKALAEIKGTLLTEADCYEACAYIIEDPRNVMSAIPSWRWTDDEVASLYPPKEATDG